MAASDNKRSDENVEVVSAYESMAQSPPSSLSGCEAASARDPAPIETLHNEPSAPPRKALARILTEYRALEFGSIVLIYLAAFVFSAMELNERPIPGIKVRLNSTAVAWSLDPSIDEIKLSEEGKSKSARALHCSKSLTIIVDCDTLSANVAIADAGDLFTSGNKSRRQLRTPEVLPGAGDRPRHARLPA
ncbi:unnamed protein product [Phytophthora fragariaefolia]|uniref:Unnamed protein product n=1 Tax=Phytophthora fragariaefolia TaxID=1490495 RepID=A0A9W7D7K3_9STRA|nr:unnamed protein product [Phytophthora fragariaefolia]